MDDCSGDCVVSVMDLTKIYGELKAVDGVSFCVRNGEVFGFLGPNGAGKTTTVRMLVGLTRITGGNALICGHDVAREYKRVRGLIGVVPDISNLYSGLTCLQNLLFSAKMYGVPRGVRRKRVEGLLKFFGLWGMRDVKFESLSRGLKRRLTIAAALTHDPKVLFLDEPTSGLDVMSRRALWDRLRDLNGSGVTIFLTTHNVYEAFHISNRVAVINKGRIVALGTPEDLSGKFSVREVVEVAFHPTNPRGEELAEHIEDALSVKNVGGRLEIVASDATAVVEGLVRYARLNGLKISTLRLRSADAEELFLKIVGESS